MNTSKSDPANLDNANQSLEMLVESIKAHQKEVCDLRECIIETNRLLLQFIEATPDSIQKSQNQSKRSIPPIGSLRDPMVQQKIISLRKNGYTYCQIIKELHKQWPNDPERNPSKSAVQRFCTKARGGGYSEFGITGW